MILAAEVLQSLPLQNDALQPLYALVGGVVLTQLIGVGFAVVRFLGARQVKKADDKEALVDGRLDKQDQRIDAVEKSLFRVESEGKQINNLIEGLRADIAGVRSGLDQRFEKQEANFEKQLRSALGGVQEKLEQVEHELRQDITRSMYDAKAMLEAKRGRRR